MTKCLIVLTFMLGSLTGSSQAPGYMGKRFTAGYGIYASPGFVGSEGLTPVNLLHEGFVEFAAKKKFSIGLSARFYNAVTPNSRSVNIRDTDVSGQIDNRPWGVTTIKGRNYMLYGKFFKKKYLAPWGKYFILGATLNTFTASYDPDQMYVAVQAYGPARSYGYYTDFGPTQQSYLKFDVMFGNGRSRIIADRIVLDYGYNINVWGLTSSIIELAEGDGTATYASEYIKAIGSKRVKAVNAFNLFLKVGYLF